MLQPFTTLHYPSLICDKITKLYPTVMVTTSLKVKIGQTLKVLGCSTKHTNKGQCYRIVPLCA